MVASIITRVGFTSRRLSRAMHPTPEWSIKLGKVLSFGVMERQTDSSTSQSSLPGLGEPVPLTDRQKELCRRLDEFYATANMAGARPSDMFRGALYVMQGSSIGLGPSPPASTSCQ